MSAMRMTSGRGATRSKRAAVIPSRPSSRRAALPASQPRGCSFPARIQASRINATATFSAEGVSATAQEVLMLPLEDNSFLFSFGVDSSKLPAPTRVRQAEEREAALQEENLRLKALGTEVEGREAALQEENVRLTALGFKLEAAQAALQEEVASLKTKAKDAIIQAVKVDELKQAAQKQDEEIARLKAALQAKSVEVEKQNRELFSSREQLEREVEELKTGCAALLETCDLAKSGLTDFQDLQAQIEQACSRHVQVEQESQSKEVVSTGEENLEDQPSVTTTLRRAKAGLEKA